jgi:hypothetical protein
MVQRQSAATASSSTDPIDPYVAARPAQLTSIDLPAARSRRRGRWFKSNRGVPSVLDCPGRVRRVKGEPHAVASRALDTTATAQGSAAIERTGRGGTRPQGRSEKRAKPQASSGICKRICKRDSAARPETGETPRADGDGAEPIVRGQRHHRRRPETAETYVVLLITQRSQVQILPPLPSSEAGSELRIRPLACLVLTDLLTGRSWIPDLGAA